MPFDGSAKLPQIHVSRRVKGEGLRVLRGGVPRSKKTRILYRCAICRRLVRRTLKINERNVCPSCFDKKYVSRADLSEKLSSAIKSASFGLRKGAAS